MGEGTDLTKRSPSHELPAHHQLVAAGLTGRFSVFLFLGQLLRKFSPKNLSQQWG